ncbi:MAG: methylmalonyl-CoA mutase family protein [Dongiaceae bacterium]
MDEKRLAAWRSATKAPEVARFPERQARFATVSGIEVKDVYTARDVSPAAAAELPGEYPLTRGLYASMYRNRMFSRRQVVGLGTAKDANERHRFVLSQGQTGLSNDFDLPTLTGYDSDDPLVRGEVGRIGVAIDTLDDMRDLMAGIPLDQVSTSMTINHPAPVLLAMYCALAEQQGVPWSRLSGTVQNDGLKEFFAQKTFALPPAPALRLTADVIEFCARHMPAWHPISLCGYQTRDCGGTADQEIGLTFAAAVTYIEEVLRRGIDIDDFAPRLSFLMYVHIDFLEEVAKFRAARRLWARLMRERFGARKPESWRFRVHVQTGAALLTAQQPENNIARGALQCLAAALGGVQSMAISTYDEAFSIPSEKAQRIALRTQQIVAFETGIADTPDPLGGSYAVEALTDELERRAEHWMNEVAKRGGMLPVIESGWIEAVLAEQAYEIQRQVESRERTVVGVNAFLDGNEEGQMPNLFRVDPGVEQEQKSRLAEVRRRRDRGRVDEALAAVGSAAAGSENLMGPVLEAVRALASEGEIFTALRSVWGEYRPAAIV